MASTRRIAEDLIPTRHSLLSRLKDWEDDQSWREFFDTYWRLIYNVALRAGLTDAEAQDVVQETILTVARKIPGFNYDPSLGSFKGWLLKKTHWRIADQFRKRDNSVQMQAKGTPLVEQVPDPDLNHGLERVWEEEWQNNLLARAMDELKEKVSPRHFQILHLCVMREWSVEKVASALGVSRAQVYVVKHRLGGKLTREVKRLRDAAG